MILLTDSEIAAALAEQNRAYKNLIARQNVTINELDKENWELKCNILALTCPDINVKKLREMTGL